MVSLIRRLPRIIFKKTILDNKKISTNPILKFPILYDNDDDNIEKKIDNKSLIILLEHIWIGSSTKPEEKSKNQELEKDIEEWEDPYNIIRSQ